MGRRASELSRIKICAVARHVESSIIPLCGDLLPYTGNPPSQSPSLECGDAGNNPKRGRALRAGTDSCSNQHALVEATQVFLRHEGRVALVRATVVLNQGDLPILRIRIETEQGLAEVRKIINSPCPLRACVYLSYHGYHLQGWTR